MVETFRVGLLTTERCNIECDHCWFESGPDRKSTMSLEDIRSYIDQAREISTVEWISFTGGEPFLHPGLLESSVKYASERGLRSECVTNCYWADTERTAEETLGGLVGAGLDVINISVDDFHQRHIPFERVRNCFNAARTLGVKIAIMCAVAKSSALRAKDVKRHLGDRGIQIIGAGKPKPTAQAIIIETGFTPVGRGAEIPEEEWMMGESPGGPCSLVLRDIGISPSGRVLPCCSAASLVEEACLGNAKEESLDEIVEHASRRPLFIALSTEGPSFLAQRLGLKETNYVNRCHLCHGVLTNPGLDRILPD